MEQKTFGLSNRKNGSLNEKNIKSKAESWDEIIKRPSVNYENLLALVSEVLTNSKSR